MGLDAIRQAPHFAGRLPYARPANQAFLEAGKGLAFTLRELGDTEAADRVVEQLLALDPSDPLGLRGGGMKDQG